LTHTVLWVQDRANIFERERDKAEEKLTDLRSVAEDTVDKAQDAIEQVESAEAKAAIAKTQGSVTHHLAKADKDAADEQVC
jgi:hypothetical protein